jgi:ABC-type amino acid transport substrate-binding protein
MAYDVFISYCAEDKLIADAVCNVLEGRKIRCWIAPRDVPAGANWGGAIIDAINETKVMVVVFSSRANKSRQVFREIERAVNNGDTIIPYRVEDVVPSKDLEFFISACHWLDAMSPPMEAHLAKLADRVSSLLNLQSDTTSPAVFSPIARPPRAVRFRGVAYGLAVVTLGLIAAFGWWAWKHPPWAPQVALQTPPDGAQIIGQPFLSWLSDGLPQENLGFEVSLAQDGKAPVIEPQTRNSFLPQGLQGELRWKVRPVWQTALARKAGPWSEERHFTTYASSVDRIVARREIRVGIAEEDGLFVRKTGAEMGGYEIELLRKIGERILADRQIAAVPRIITELHVWSNAYFEELGKDESLDVLASGISIDPQREEQFHIVFSKPSAQFPQTIVTARNTRPFENGQLVLKKIGVPHPSTNENLLRKILGPEADARLVPHEGSGSYDRMLAKLLKGDLDGVAIDKPYTVKKIADIKKSLDVELAVTDLDENVVPGVVLDRTGFALRKSDVRFLNEINKQMDSLSAEKIALIAKYLPPGAVQP